MKKVLASETEMKQWGAQMGHLLKGGEFIELIGDVGAGKTTFTKGLAQGMGIDDTIQSPTFTISRIYDAPGGLMLAHYDFYRLSDAGIMADELQETSNQKHAVTVIEWGDIIHDIMPADYLKLEIASPSETQRDVTITAHGPKSQAIVEQLA